MGEGPILKNIQIIRSRKRNGMATGMASRSFEVARATPGLPGSVPDAKKMSVVFNLVGDVDDILITY